MTPGPNTISLEAGAIEMVDRGGIEHRGAGSPLTVAEGDRNASHVKMLGGGNERILVGNGQID